MKTCQWCMKQWSDDVMEYVRMGEGFYWRCKLCTHKLKKKKKVPPKVQPLDIYPEDVEFLEI